MKLLVIDNELDIVNLLKPPILNAGYKLEVATDGFAGLSAAVSRPPNLIILEAKMPGMDGLPLLGVIRTWEDTGNTPVIMLTASRDVETVKSAIELGISDFMAKPFKISDLMNRVKKRGYKGDLISGTPLQWAELRSPAFAGKWILGPVPVISAQTIDKLGRLLMLLDTVAEASFEFDLAGSKIQLSALAGFSRLIDEGLNLEFSNLDKASVDGSVRKRFEAQFKIKTDSLSRNERLQRFVAFLQGNGAIDGNAIQAVYRRMGMLDRRFGQLAALQGFLEPQVINDVLDNQEATEQKFGDIAVKMGLLTEAQAEKARVLQADEVFAFAHAAIIEKALAGDKAIEQMREFNRIDPAQLVARPAHESTKGRKVREILRKIKAVSPLPGAVQKALQYIDDPKSEMADVAKAVNLDPSLSTTFVRLCNSAQFGLTSKVTNVQAALVVLGTRKIKELILTSGIMEKFKGTSETFRNQFWSHSIQTSEWARELARECSYKDEDGVVMASFIHNIGKLIVREFFGSEAKQLEEVSEKLKKSKDDSASKMATVLSSEREIIGMTHADIAGFVFRQWKLPKLLVEATMFHHHPLSELKQMKDLDDGVKILHMSARLVFESESSRDQTLFRAKIPGILKDYAGLLELKESHFGTLPDSVTMAVKRTKRHLGITE